MKRIQDTHLKGHTLHKLMGLGIVDAETSRSGQERSLSDESFPYILGHKVEALIGTGGMGRVYRARQLKTNRLVAVKRKFRNLPFLGSALENVWFPNRCVKKP